MGGKELQQLAPRQLEPEYNRPVGVGAVRLEPIPGQIQAEDANLVHGRSPLSGASRPATLAHSMPPKGASTASLAKSGHGSNLQNLFLQCRATHKCHDAIAGRESAGNHSAEPGCNAMETDERKSRDPKRDPARVETPRHAILRRWSGYRRRGPVQTKVNRVKLLGQCLIADDSNRQVAEIQFREAVLDRSKALGIRVTTAAV